MFYILVDNLTTRTALIDYLKQKNLHAVFHYISLHKSSFYASKHDGRTLDNCDRYTDTLIRLPFYFELSNQDVKQICDTIKLYFDEQ
jgi:dTDP-4-amino-4,6-dideoxygalactose transaminase